MDEYLTTDDVCKILKIAKVTLYKWLKEGKIKHIKIGKFIRIKETDLEKFIRDLGK